MIATERVEVGRGYYDFSEMHAQGRFGQPPLNELILTKHAASSAARSFGSMRGRDFS